MKKSIGDIIKKICSITDMLAGVCFFSVMALVLSNIIMRNIFRMPILGTVEIVGLLTATGLGLALSNCEMNNGNIVMDVFTEKLPKKAQKIIDVVVYLISLVFFAIVVWRIFVFAGTSFTNGRVTSTASIPIFPFIFLLGINVFFLCVVLAYKLVRDIKDISAESRQSASKKLSRR
ncbi:MAG: TRAP transporter small permease [Firmicutes bacterium]|nr:TRAP transporter small permease [Bacillota bacterium]